MPVYCRRPINRQRQYVCMKLGADNITHAIAIGFRKGLIQ
jgi:DNA-binding CsgD family transcriptional regulator